MDDDARRWGAPEPLWTGDALVNLHPDGGTTRWVLDPARGYWPDCCDAHRPESKRVGPVETPASIPAVPKVPSPAPQAVVLPPLPAPPVVSDQRGVSLLLRLAHAALGKPAAKRSTLEETVLEAALAMKDPAAARAMADELLAHDDLTPAERDRFERMRDEPI
jgi:hypothetical protein